MHVLCEPRNEDILRIIDSLTYGDTYAQYIALQAQISHQVLQNPQGKVHRRLPRWLCGKTLGDNLHIHLLH